MDDATIAGTLNQALVEASGSVHFREHFNEIGEILVIEYHFTKLPEKVDLRRLYATFPTVEAVYWRSHDDRNTVSIDGSFGVRKVSVEISLRQESE